MTNIGLTHFINFFKYIWWLIRGLKNPQPYKKVVFKERGFQIGLTFATLILATLDILGAGFCIRETGGAETSIFTPFLLIIPTVIVLLDIFSWPVTVGWGLVCIIVFRNSLDPFAGFNMVSNQNRHHILLVVSTGICMFFPFIYLNTARNNKICPSCQGTGILSAEIPKECMPVD